MTRSLTVVNTSNSVNEDYNILIGESQKVIRPGEIITGTPSRSAAGDGHTLGIQVYEKVFDKDFFHFFDMKQMG